MEIWSQGLHWAALLGMLWALIRFGWNQGLCMLSMLHRYLMGTGDWGPPPREISIFARRMIVNTNSLPFLPLSEMLLADFKHRMSVWTRWSSLIFPTLKSWEYINKTLERYGFQTPLKIIISVIILLSIINVRSYFRSLFFPKNQNLRFWGMRAPGDLHTLWVCKTQ